MKETAPTGYTCRKSAASLWPTGAAGNFGRYFWIVEVRRVQDLAQIPQGTLARLHATAAGAASGYSLVRWTCITPEERIDQVAALHEPHGARRSRTAAFMLARRDDALFFAEWLEYHFAEIGEQTRIGSRHAELKQLRPRIAGREVRVEFSYRYDLADAAESACTEAVCRWIESEVKRRFDLSAEHYLPDALHFAGIGSRAAAGYSFSSK